MTNLECVCAVLAAHREMRMWDDQTVATDLVTQLGLDPDGEAQNAKPVAPTITEDEVVALEAAAQEAADKAHAARDALNAQNAEEADEPPPPPPAPVPPVE